MDNRDDSLTLNLQSCANPDGVYIEKVSYKKQDVKEFSSGTSIEQKYQGEVLEYFLEYPAVYIMHALIKKRGESAKKYEVYVGESKNVDRRIQQHLDAGEKFTEIYVKVPEVYVIGHEMFNKSLTLDVENRIIQNMLANPNVGRLLNGRENAQGSYYTKDYFDRIFAGIWAGLRADNEALFLEESIIHDSAIYKASPFHDLTEEQANAEEEILDAISNAVESGNDGQLIIVNGEAGSGKTVLLSHLFRYLHLRQADVEPERRERQHHFQDLKFYFLSPQNEQLKVYQAVATKLGLHSKDEESVLKPVQLLNKLKKTGEKADVVLVDEAHLLLTQGNQAYQGKNQLDDLVKNARVVVAVYDQKQIQQTNQYVSMGAYEQLIRRAVEVIELRNQLRMRADRRTISWIRDFIDNGAVHALPKDREGYDLRIFESPTELRLAINDRAEKEDSQLSRMLATFDWEYSSARSPEATNVDGEVSSTWNVSVPDYDFSMPWNLQLEAPAATRSVNLGDSWPERVETIDEVGSIYTIQGLDLNYAGVILGPSVKFRDGKVVIDPSASWNRHATQKRTFEDGNRGYVSSELLKNQLNVLMTRGVDGLYLFAVDPELQQELLRMQSLRASGEPRDADS